MVYTYNEISNTIYRYDNDNEIKYINISDVLTSFQLIGTELTADNNSLVDNLLEVRNIGSNIVKIENNCFYNCRNLTSVNLNNVTYIDNQAFKNCTNLTSIDIFDKAKAIYTIGDEAFYNSGLISVHINLKGKTYSSNEEYEGCIPVLKDYGPYAGVSSFANCSQLKEVRLCCSTDIGKYMFANCTSLTSVQMVNHGSCVGEGCFSDCTALQRITLPSHFEILSKNMFKGCTNLSSITIQDPDDDKSKFKNIEDFCLKDCTSLTSITFPRSFNSIYSIDNDNFVGSNLKNIHFKGITIEEMDNLAEIRLTTTTFKVDKTTTNNFKYGKWYANCKELIVFAKKMNAPIFLYECRNGCSRCSTFKKEVLKSSSWNEWMSQTNMFFAYGHVEETGLENENVQRVRWELEGTWSGGKNKWTYYPSQVKLLPGIMMVWWNKNPENNRDIKYAYDIYSNDPKDFLKPVKEIYNKYFSSYTPNINCISLKEGDLEEDYTLGNIGHDATLYAYNGSVSKKYSWDNKEKKIIITETT